MQKLIDIAALIGKGYQVSQACSLCKMFAPDAAKRFMRLLNVGVDEVADILKWSHALIKSPMLEKAIPSDDQRVPERGYQMLAAISLKEQKQVKPEDVMFGTCAGRLAIVYNGHVYY